MNLHRLSSFGIILFLLIFLIPSSSAWLSGYNYRTPIEINNTGDNLTYYQYNFSINTQSLISSGKMNTNGSDCRITNETDVLQSFWNETAFNISDTGIWVNATFLGNKTNTTHYIYYGKSSTSSADDGDTTFPFFDDFNGININEKYLTSWSKSASNPLQDKTCQNWFIAVYSNYNNEDKIYLFENRNAHPSNTIQCSSFTRANAATPAQWTDHGIVFTGVGAHDDGHVEPHGIIFETQSMADAREGVGEGLGTPKWRIYYSGKGSGEAVSKYSANFAYATESDLTSWTAYASNPVYDHDATWGFCDNKVCIYNNQVWLHHCKYKVGTSCDPAFFSVSDDGISSWTDKTRNWNAASEDTVVGTMVPFSTGILLTGRNAGNTAYDAYFTTDGDDQATYSGNPIIPQGGAGDFDDTYVAWASIVVDKNGSADLNSAGTYYLYYIGDGGASTYKLGLATSSILTEESETSIDSDKWTSSGENISSGIVNINAANEYIRSISTFQYEYAVKSKMKVNTYANYGTFGFKTGIDLVSVDTAGFWIDATPRIRMITDNPVAGSEYIVNLGDMGTGWKTYEFIRHSAASKLEYLVDDGDTSSGNTTDANAIPTGTLPIQLHAHTGNPSIDLDWVFVRKYTTNEIVSLLGAEESASPVITLLSQTPSTIYKNSTGYLNISYGIYHNSSGLNNTSVSFIYRNYDWDLSDSNHSIRPPINNLASEWNYDGRILRGANRNESPGLNFENNDTITGGDTYTWSGLDENSTKLTIVPVSSTYTKVYINATVHCIMPQMWYLDRTDQQQATKIQLAIHKTSNVLIKFWNFEIFKGNTDFLGVGYTDTLLSSNPALWPSDANPVNFYYVNSSYDPATGGDPITSGYAVYMGSLNASGWTDHVYSRSNSNYVRGFIDNNYLHTIVDTTNISYLYFTSNTPSSHPFYINMTNVASSTNVSFANTNTLWAGNTPPYTPQAYTPNVWFAFMKLNMSLDHKLYAADNNDLWGVSSMNRTNITQALFPPTTPLIDHFHFLGETDYDMDGVYYGNFSIGCGVSTDPDGGDVTHNLTLHYANNLTFVTIINNTFTDKDITHNGVYFDANFSSIPYYSDDVNYTLRLIATDDESESITVWLGVNFTLSITPIITLYTPSTPVTTIQHDTQEFTINISQIVNVTWYIDGSAVLIVNDTNYSTYSNSTAPIGTYNVTAHVENVNGTRQQIWEWNVEDKVFAALLQLQADIDKMKRTQTIIQALIFLVIGVIVGVVAQRRRFNDEDSEKPIESKNN